MEDISDTQRILELQFMQSFTTGNLIIDTLIKGFIITLTGALFLNIKTLIRDREYYMDKISEVFGMKLGRYELKFSGSLKDSQFNFSVKLMSILHHLEKVATTNPSIKILNEFVVEERNYDEEYEAGKKRKAEHLLPETIEVEKDVFCEVSCNMGNGDKKEKEVHVTIYSKVMKIPQLVDLVRKWEKFYEEHNMFHNGLKYFVFKHPDDHDRYGYPTQYTEFSFESGKKFSNVFFPEKDELVEKIQFFSENESWYMENGIPYMFGLLLHGEPGCGKTSTIKAIANMTQRHIVSVPLKNVRNISDLYQVFYGEKINKVTIPMNKRLYVLEDIDCAGLDDIVKKREQKEPKSLLKKPKSDEESSVSSLEVITTDQKKCDLKLSDLLEAFDGVLEMNGRMLVMTTNHLENLDPALIRPGRVDSSLEFKRCNKNAILEFFAHFFKKENLEQSEKDGIMDGVWTPAEVAQICIRHRTNMELAMKKIHERKSIP